MKMMMPIKKPDNFVKNMSYSLNVVRFYNLRSKIIDKDCPLPKNLKINLINHLVKILYLIV